jgi:predicted NUDIX family phosphoesterase
MAADGEQVLVVPRASLIEGPGWLGVRSVDLAPVLTLVDRDGRFEPRSAAETDPSLKQVIPYLVLRDGPQVFLMRRTRAGGDARLHDRWSIGVGGHLNPGDGDVDGGLRREWSEEVEAAFVPEFRFVGLLNDDTTDVGRVHIGLVFEADAAARPVAVRETEKLTGSFVDLSAVREVYDGLETWSQLILPSLERDVG